MKNQRFYYIIISLIILQIYTQGTLPTPHCKSSPIQNNNIPLTINQILVKDTNNYFTGYNLQIDVLIDQDKITNLPKKLQLLAYNYDTPLTGLKSYHLQHKGNNWGAEYYSLVEDKFTTKLYLGVLKNKSSVPEINQSIVVEEDQYTFCFDSVLFLQYGLAIVDCTKKIKYSQQLVRYQNIFYIIDFTKKQITTFKNQIYVKFSLILKRKFLKYTDPITGFPYIIRAYLGNSVDDLNKYNTYFQIFLCNDLKNLQTIQLIDRTYFAQNQLMIMDIKIYMGDIFILDYFKGLYRLHITKNQQLQIISHYQGQGFSTFSVYSDDYDQQVLIALGNNHAIYQINFNNPNNPILVSKYTLMANSLVYNIAINRKFVIVQSTNNISLQNRNYMLINYTWIFNKGSRTYMNAYKIIDHQSSTNFIDINKQQNKILLIDEKGLRNYQLNQAILTIQQYNSQKVDFNTKISIQATSIDFLTNQTQVCLITMNVYYLQKNNMSLWKSELNIPKLFYSNYPGKVQIDLDRYVIGPNLTHSIIQQDSQDLPVYWINQLNKSKISIDKLPNFGEINFFYTQIVQHYGQDNPIYYYQDIKNITHIAICVFTFEQSQLSCRVLFQHSFNSVLLFLKTSAFDSGFGLNYYYCFILQQNPYQILIYNFVYFRRIAAITFQNDYSGKIGSITTSNGILYVTLPYIKTINAYKLSKCKNMKCQLQFSINAQTLKSLKIDYFYPVQLITNKYHPEVLFIRALGSLLILDVDNKDNIKIITQLFSPAIINTNYRIAVNKNSLIVVSNPNIIQQYSLQFIYTTKDVIHIKNFNLYSYKIAEGFDLQFSDQSPLFYVNCIDSITNLSTILVFRTNTFLINTFYDAINLGGLYQHSNLQIQVSGKKFDYLSIIASGIFYLYRQYFSPKLIVENTFSNFTFSIISYNSAIKQNIQNISVIVANYPEGFTPSQQFNKINKSLVIQKTGLHIWDTRKWFEGNILDYQIHFQNQNNKNEKILIKKHINQQNLLRWSFVDLVDTNFGAMALSQDIIKINPNGTLKQILLLHNNKQNQNCVKIASRSDQILSIIGCQIEGGGVNIYLSSNINQKGFSWGPYISEAFEVRKLEMINNLLVLTDAPEEGQNLFLQGAVYIYGMNLDPISQNQMDLIQIINSNDFIAAHNWNSQKAYITNSHILYDIQTNTYRLYITEAKNGIFVIDFQHQHPNLQLNILAINYIDLNILLNQNNFHMPSDAVFLAISHLGIRQNPLYDMQNILITTKGYHNFQITIIFDNFGRVTTSILHRVYYRYAYYLPTNYIKVNLQYMAISYRIPQIFEWINSSKQIIAIYDTKDYIHESDAGYSQRYMLGGFVLNNTNQVPYGFMKNSNGEINLIIMDKENKRNNLVSLQKNLSVKLLQGYDKQQIKLMPYNDFDRKQFKIIVKKDQTNDQGKQQTVLIVVFSFLGFSLCLYLIIVYYNKRTTSNINQQNNQLEQQLLNQPHHNVINQSLLISNRTTMLQFNKDNTQNDISQNSQQIQQENSQNKSIKADSIVDPPMLIPDQKIQNTPQ